MSEAAAPGAPSVPQRTSAYAWVVLAMLAFIYIFNFLDRQLMSVLIESIKKDPAFATTLPDGTTVGLTDAEMRWSTPCSALASASSPTAPAAATSSTSAQRSGQVSQRCAACRRTT
jgi:phytoene dehydrogenase-like protein